MRWRCSYIIRTLVAAVLPLALGAQTPRDTAACRSILAASTPDSAVARVGLIVRPFDTTAVRMTSAYRELVATSVRQFFTAPQPLPLRTYGSQFSLSGNHGGPAFVTADLAATYRAILHRDGHLSGVRVTGGTRDSAFDAAMVRAIRAVSDSSLLTPAVAPSVVFDGDSLAVQFVVARDDVVLPARFTASRGKGSASTPLLRMRTPIRQVTGQVGPRGPRRAPEYPRSMRAARVEGRTTIDFVVDASGQPDMSTVQLVATPAADFVASILDALPAHRFTPLMVEGCAVAVRVREPFEFHFSP